MDVPITAARMKSFMVRDQIADMVEGER